MLLYFMKIDIRQAEPYIESFDWLKSKGATINPKNKKIINASSIQ